VRECCESAGIPVEEGLARLGKAGIQAHSGGSLRVGMKLCGKRPAEVLEVLYAE